MLKYERFLSDFISGNKRLPAPRGARERCLEAEMADLPEEALARLAGDPDPRVRIRVAAREGLPEQVVRMLAGDPDWYVRQQLQAVADKTA
jgi:hypothetical protein